MKRNSKFLKINIKFSQILIYRLSFQQNLQSTPNSHFMLENCSLSIESSNNLLKLFLRTESNIKDSCNVMLTCLSCLSQLSLSHSAHVNKHTIF